MEKGEPPTVDRFKTDERVSVRTETLGTKNRRVPSYVRGKTGTIVAVHGVVPGYELDHRDDWGPLYSVLFNRSDLFGGPTDVDEKIIVDLHEPWLRAETDSSMHRAHHVVGD